MKNFLGGWLHGTTGRLSWVLLVLLVSTVALAPEVRADCYSRNGCGGSGQSACTVLQCFPSCTGDLQEIRGRCVDCYGRHNCGSAGQAACPPTKCILPCRNDANLYLDFRTGKCASVPRGSSALGASLGSVGALLDDATQNCIATANVLLPALPVSRTLDQLDSIKSTALFAGQTAGRCSQQFDYGYVCGAGSYAATYFKMIARDSNLANQVIQRTKDAWNNECSNFIDPVQRGYCAAIVAAGGEAIQAGRCVAEIVEELFERAGMSSPPSHDMRLLDSVCQGLGTFTYGFTVDQLLGILLAEFTEGGSEVAATIKDFEDLVKWLNRVRQLHSKFHAAANFLQKQENLRTIPACQGIFF